MHGWVYHLSTTCYLNAEERELKGHLKQPAQVQNLENNF